MAYPDRHTGFRVIELIVMIQNKEYPSVKSIAEKFECSVRTAERYIERVRDLVANDLTYDRTRRGYYFAQGGPDLPDLKLSEGEAVAMFLGARLLEQCRGTPYEAVVAGALSKLACLFPKEINLSEVPNPAGWVSFHMESLRGEERQVMEMFLALEKARSEQVTVHIRYFTASRGEWSERDLDPYCLHFSEGAWYVIGRCHWRKQVKMFALDRIRALEPTGRRFEVPPDFALEKFLESAFRLEVGEPVNVAIRFGPEQARYVRGKVWHPSQEIEELPPRAAGVANRGEGRPPRGDHGGPPGSGGTRDGAPVVGRQGPKPADATGQGGLILRLRVGGLGEIKRWVLQFGAGAEVLEPEELREMVRAEAEGVIRQYAETVTR